MKLVKKILPSSMAAQMILVVLLALLLAQATSLIILGSAYRTLLSDINQKSRLQQMESLVLLLEESPYETYSTILAASRSRNAWFTVNKRSAIHSAEMTSRERRVMSRLLDQIGDSYRERILVNINVRKDSRQGRKDANGWQQGDRNADEDDCENPDNCNKSWHHHHRRMMKRGMHNRSFREGPDGQVKLTTLKVSVQMHNGLWLNLRASAPEAPPLAARQTLVFLALSVVFVLLALTFMIRRITRPLRMLSKASNCLGLGQQVGSLPEKGPEDLRETIRAFNQMNSRLQRFVSDRTQMLAALSHDLRTPLTTMRLRVELMPDSKDRDQLLVALEEMQQMSEAALAFMRQASDNEETRQVELGAMLGSLCDDLVELGQDVSFSEGAETIISCRPVSLKRAFRNLIENAVKYGEKAEVSFCLGEGPEQRVIVNIQDTGPGIPEDRVEKVFQPFFRLEGSRNRDTGGIGLGLSIARNIVRNHGGDIQLINNQKGLLVRVILP